VSLVLGAACSGADGPDASAPSDTASPPDDTAVDSSRRSGGGPGAAEDGTFHVAESLGGDLVVRSAADDAADEVARLRASDMLSGRVVCLVHQQVDDWLEVGLPVGAGDTTGWVARDDVALSRHRFRIEVALGAHELTVYSGSLVALSAPIAVGPDAPPAGANLFVTALVQPPDPNGPYGAYAFGLSGVAYDAQAFAAGRGVVAVHGVADPSTLGSDVPTGSIGVAGDVVARAADSIGLPLGTPVEVVA
jgi:hypothetical protein